MPFRTPDSLLAPMVEIISPQGSIACALDVCCGTGAAMGLACFTGLQRGHACPKCAIQARVHHVLLTFPLERALEVLPRHGFGIEVHAPYAPTPYPMMRVVVATRS